VLMGMFVFITAATLCVYLLRSAWRMLVEVPDRDQVYVHDAVEDFLSRSISGLLVANSGLFLIMMVRAVG
jgi:hypothetical protein